MRDPNQKSGQPVNPLGQPAKSDSGAPQGPKTNPVPPFKTHKKSHNPVPPFREVSESRRDDEPCDD